MTNNVTNTLISECLGAFSERDSRLDASHPSVVQYGGIPRSVGSITDWLNETHPTIGATPQYVRDTLNGIRDSDMSKGEKERGHVWILGDTTDPSKVGRVQSVLAITDALRERLADAEAERVARQVATVQALATLKTAGFKTAQDGAAIIILSAPAKALRKKAAPKAK